MNEFEMDWRREERTGVAEAVFCEDKSAAQIASILKAAGERPLLLTRFAAEKFASLPEASRGALDHDPASRTAFYRRADRPLARGPGIVCAGTSDLPVALEARRTLAFHGYSAPVIPDVGVAGLWRLMKRLDEIRAFSVVIAVAGMEGALFSVLAGLVEAPVIAVPTSVGYGVAAGGRAALNGALASCAQGLVSVNIDNGFGAACAAIRMLRRREATPSDGTGGTSP
ncbi:MAG: nickel pincer cofactor biosynthesis protein LarB [Candidatus Accumulibacter sp.]|jgi:NCAIR mutase (PurE)-related protein|nr:nickel pincer cofactor biosynthesis protein LarB [Accumulibacter sp.]